MWRNTALKLVEAKLLQIVQTYRSSHDILNSETTATCLQTFSQLYSNLTITLTLNDLDCIQKPQRKIKPWLQRMSPAI